MSVPTRDLSAGGEAEGTSIHEFGPFRLDPRERLLTRDGQPVALTPKAFDLLVYLVERPGRLVDKQALMAALWPDAVVEEANLAYTVSALRKALGDGHDGEQIIQTVPTRGYRFVAPVRVVLPQPSPTSASERRGRGVLLPVTLVIGILAGAFAVWLWPRPDSTPRPVVRIELPVADVQDIGIPAVSPDGQHIVYSARDGTGEQQLYMRSLDSLAAVPLAGTAGGHYPFFSPDGRAIAFFKRGQLVTLNLASGKLSGSRGPFRTGIWAPDGSIYLGRAWPEGLGVRAPAGGEVRSLTTLAPGDIAHGWPDLLPDGRHLLFTVVRGENVDDARTEVLSLDSGERRTVMEGGHGARYLPTGHLVCAREGSLIAVGFDPQSLRVQGSPVRVLEGVGSISMFGAHPLFSVSNSGTLAYYPGGLLSPRNEIVWLENGRAAALAAPPGSYVDPTLSADGRRLAVSAQYGVRQQDVWLHDFARGLWTRLTTNPLFDSAPVWHPGDENQVVYTARRPEGVAGDLLSIRADGSGAPELLYESPYWKYATSSAPAARLLAFVMESNGGDIWLLDLRDKPAARPFLETRFSEYSPALSPDGRWLVYESNESGEPQIYVRPLSGDGRWQVSPDGGDKPRWSRNGDRIVYRRWKRAAEDGAPMRMMTVGVTTSPSFAAGKPQVLAEGDFARGGNATPNYDISPDGRRLLVIRAALDQPPVPLVVIENWFTELRQKLGQR
jgi:DNA-binding winged helix-turn-helix (wHTH) protein/Tol biopolymer transport system component